MRPGAGTDQPFGLAAVVRNSSKGFAFASFGASFSSAAVTRAIQRLQSGAQAALGG